MVQIQYTLLTRDRARKFGHLLVSLGADLPWDYWTIENLLVDRPQKWRLSMLATVDDNPVGYLIASYREGSVHIHHNIVGQKWRGMGIGRKLMNHLSKNAYALGANNITFKIHRNNHGAINLFQSLGYAFMDKQNEQSGSDQSELLWMSAQVTDVLNKLK